MKISGILLFFFLFFHEAEGQNLVGLRGSEIRKYMKENQKQMNLNNVNNSSYSYLKYSDSSDNQTMLFFLDRDSVCSSIRIICDRNTGLTRKKEFDVQYSKAGNNRWTEKKNGIVYRIEFLEEDWSSVITIQPDK